MKLVSNQINPHFSLADSIKALGCFLSKKTVNTTIFEQFFYTKNYLLLNSARSGLQILIDTLKLPKGSTIAIPAYCCSVMAVPFLSSGYKITWIDTDENGLISPQDFEVKIKQNNISLVLVPHIFGQPAPLEAIYTLAKTKDIIVVEDNAHMLNKNFSYSDFKLYSFGREKVLSTVSGGALVWNVNSPHAHLFQKIELKPTSLGFQFQHAIQPLIYSLALPWWRAGGAIIPMIAKHFKLLPLAVHPAEKQGQNTLKVQAMGSTQQRILEFQIEHNTQRQASYHEKNIYWQQILPTLFPKATIIKPQSSFRVIVRTENNQKILQKASQNGYHLTEWNGQPIAPFGTNLQAFGYKKGMCPMAEKTAKELITLPTNIRTSQKDIELFKTIFANDA